MLSLSTSFPTEIPIGDHRLPIKVRRFANRAEYEAFAVKWDALIGPRRGTAEPTESEEAARLAEQRVFVEEAITGAVSLEPGMLRVDDVDVVTGAGLYDLFHMRWDVLTPIMLAILTKNRNDDLLKKTSSLPPDSATGSEASTQVRDGEKPALTAAPAGSSSTAPTEDATEWNDGVLSGSTRPE